MSKDKPYIERQYVELQEVTDYDYLGSVSRTTWYARVEGPASTKERISMTRSSKSAGEALLLLTEALAEQGWELRG